MIFLRRSLFLIVLMLLVSVQLTALAKSGKQSKSERADKAIKAEKVIHSVRSKIIERGLVDKEPLKALDGLKKIYSEEGITLWSEKAMKDFVKWLPEVSKEGLNPDNYHLDKLSDLIKKVDDPEDRVKAEFLFTDAVLMLTSHFAFGINITQEQKYSWYKKEKVTSLIDGIVGAIKGKNVENYLKSLLPKDVRYVHLKEQLAVYEQIAKKTDWVTIGKGDKLEEGVEDARVRLLRRRLEAQGYISEKASKSASTFDAKLASALKKFQENHGLEPDGVAGAQTIEALNTPVGKRVIQMRISLDRLREILPQLPSHYLMVSIPAFRLWVYEKDNPVLTMKVIDGRRDRKTPLMVKDMLYMVLSPAWNVPNSIAIKDKLPEITKDPSFISRNNMVLTKKGEDGAVHVVDAESVDWSTVTAENFNYQLTQKPGDGNALGKVKFVFPNEDNIYLHDTSQPELFSKDIRSFSSGCIRIEKPLDLALYLLQSHGEWSKSSIEASMNSGNQKVIPLRQRIPVILTYISAWGNKDNSATFGYDIYGYDQKVASLFGGK